MTLSTASLLSRFGRLEAETCKPNRYVVAFSGGVDSTALLHIINQLLCERNGSATKLLAIHVDHNLHMDSGRWAEHCMEFATKHDIEFRKLHVAVPKTDGKGLEAAARQVRYVALAAELASDDWLLTAHHRNDQAETLLLNLLRGSGPAGVAGIAESRRLGPGWLIRPLLDVDQAALVQYAQDGSLQWLDDPSNVDRRFDRNFLRHEVLPQFANRWPNVAARLQRSASRASEASELLAELARIDMLTLGIETSRLPIDRLSELSRARQRNLLRYALTELGLTRPSADTLERVITEVIPARTDAQPLVSWPGASVRRYRNTIYLLPEKPLARIESEALGGCETNLGPGLGTLKLIEDAEVGLSEALIEAGLTIRVRDGGEEFRPQGQLHTKKLKKLLQEEGVVPWMRDRLPLLYAGERLVAVGDLWLADDSVTKPGVAVHWIDRPALH